MKVQYSTVASIQVEDFSILDTLSQMNCAISRDGQVIIDLDDYVDFDEEHSFIDQCIEFVDNDHENVRFISFWI